MMIPRAHQLLWCNICSSRFKLFSAAASPNRNLDQLHGFGLGNGSVNFKLGERAFHSQNVNQNKSPGQPGQTPLIPTRRTYRPRRAFMYVPGSDEKKIKKIPILEADCIVLDCEDGVAFNKKKEARKLIRETLDNKEINFGRSERTVRLNSVQSGFCEDDLKEILSVKNLPTTISLPKVETVEHVKWFLSKAKPLLENRKKDIPEPINLILFIESALSLLSLVDTTKGAIEACRNSNFVVDALCFGSDDYCASIGSFRTNEATEIAYPRQYIATVARAYQLQAIDIVYIDFRDQNGLIKQAMAGSAMGYTGKQVIHPTQVSICHEAFSPTPNLIKMAEELIKEYEEQSQAGQGVFRFKENSIDMPLVLQARNVLDLAASLKSSVEKAEKQEEIEQAAEAKAASAKAASEPDKKPK